MSPIELYYRLRGELPRYSDEETLAQRIGSKIEPLIAELAAEDLGIKIRRSPTRRHRSYEWMVANLDFEIVGNPKGPGVLEIKNRSGMKPCDQLPDDIAIQLIHQLAVTDRAWGIVAILFGFGHLKTFEVQRDREMEEYLLKIEARFLARVSSGNPPSEEWNSTSLGILKQLYPQDNGKTIVLPQQSIEHAEGFLLAKQDIESAEERKSYHEGILKSSIGDAMTAELPGWGEITWKSNKPGKAFDKERFAIDHPNLYEEYQKSINGARVFRVKREKGLVKI
jgi:predicted phage-related endonuclease